MPHSDTPTIHDWIPYLKKQVGKVDKNTYFIGHSIGCQTILRYLKTLKNNEKIGGCVLVAGFFDLTEYSYTDEPKYEEEKRRIARPWVKSSINFNKIKKHTNKFVAIFSDNDPYVSLDNSEIFRKKLNAKIIIEHKKGHFDPYHNIRKVPSALKSLLEISK